MAVVVLDYGMGNLRSVSKALEHLGASVLLTEDPQDIAGAERLVLPGVGSFGDAVNELHSRGMFFPLRRYLQTGGPFLGICLGLQLLYAASEESPGAAGLGIFQDTVRLFPSEDIKIPHMGWNQVRWAMGEHPMKSGVPDMSFFYFVHSFYAPCDNAITLGSCSYGGEKFSAAIAAKNIFASQFHPEKSQRHGLAVLKNFLAWRP